MILLLLRHELVRARHERFLWLAAAVQVLMAWIARQGARSLAGPAGLDGPTYMVFSMNLAGTLTTPLFCAVFAAGLVAGDHGRGTIRVLYAHPVHRHAVLIAKFCAAILVALGLHAIHLAAALAIALQMPLEAATGFEGPLRTMVVVWLELAAAAAVQAAPLIATAAFAIAVSTLCQQAATAIGITVGILLALEPLKALLPADWDRWIFTSHFDTPTAIASSRMDQIAATWTGAEMGALTMSCILAVIAFTLVAWRVQAKQAITP